MDRSKFVERDTRALFAAGTVTGLTDGDLLDRYVNRRDDAAQVAFAAIVERHGPMVLGVCRRILCNTHEAEDAFQATFLVLIRKARAVRVGDSLAPWLYGVSHRVAMRARAHASRRGTRGRLDLNELTAAPDRGLADREARSVIDDELIRLPERIRSPIVLCDLEGLTHEEASRRLGCPIGTIKSRLTRGREQLGVRLARRGLTLSAGGLGSLVCAETLAAKVRPDLSEATIRGAMKYAMGRWGTAGAFPASVSALTEGVLRTMVWANVKLTGLLLLGVVAVGMGLSGQRATAEDRTPQGLSRVSREPDPIRGAAEPGRVAGKTMLVHAVESKVEPVVDSVNQPKLKVVQIANAAKVLKGQTVESRITVSNTGNGIAKGVVVRARLSPGLRSPDDASSEANQLELDLGDLRPGQHFELDPLVAEAFLGGEQWCKVEATSPDVAPGAEEAKSTQVVTVVEPKLALTLVGPQQRYTDTVAAYTLTVMNPGDATARNVRVQALLPVSGRLVQLPPGARFDPSTRRLSWDPFQLDPGEKEKAKLTFEVRIGGPGLYQVTGQAMGEGLTAKEMTSTNVIALADLDLDITEDRRVVDVDQVTTFTIKVKNKGSKEATRILIRGRHSPEMVVRKTAGTDEPARYEQDPAGKAIDGEFVFPMIERLDPGKEIVLGVQVQALKIGLGTCRIYVTHDDVGQAIEDMDAVRITQAVGR